MTRKRNNKCQNSICACTGACFVDDGTGDFAPVSDRIKLERLRSRMLGWDDAEEEIKELRNKLEYVYRNILFGFEYKTFDFTILYKEALAWREAQPSRDTEVKNG